MSPVVLSVPLPGGTLLEPYRVEHGYVDCFVADLGGAHSLGDVIAAFYSSRAFYTERLLLGLILGKRASDADALRLAAGETDRFSAWTVEARRENEILLCDFQSRTRSWLMVQPAGGGTRVHFGSAVVPAKLLIDRLLFSALLGFHRWYSRILLASAVRDLAVR